MSTLGTNVLESLEHRLLFASATLDGRVLRVLGDDDQADAIVVRLSDDQTQVVVDFEDVGDQLFDRESIRRIRVRGLGGDDDLSIDDNVGIRARLDGNAGDDALAGHGFLHGGRGADDITGSDQRDFIFGGPGDDTVNAGDGNDFVFAGSGDDNVDGEGGNDVLFGYAGNDSIQGGDGNDRLFGIAGSDTLEGEEGDDTLYGGGGPDTLDGGAGGNVVRSGESRRIAVILDELTRRARRFIR